MTGAIVQPLASLEERENVDLKIGIMKKTQLNTKSESYCDAMTGLWEDNLLSQLFFSRENMKIIKNAIRADVYAKSDNKYVVQPPNDIPLKMIMKSYFINHADFYPDHITEQVSALNQRVVDFSVNQLMGACEGYVQFIADQNKVFEPLARPKNYDRDFKELKLQPF
jgi:hypothetical protein